MSTCNENLFDHPFTLQPNNDAGSTGTVKSDLHRLYHKNEPRSRYYCCHCIDEDSEAQKYCHLPKVTQGSKWESQDRDPAGYAIKRSASACAAW